MCVSLAVNYQMKAEWRFIATDSGEACVVTVGVSKMRRSFVGCWIIQGPGWPAVARNMEKASVLFG